MASKQGALLGQAAGGGYKLPKFQLVLGNTVISTLEQVMLCSAISRKNGL